MLSVGCCSYCGNFETDVNMVTFKNCETFQEFPEFWAHSLSEEFFERVQKMENPLICMKHFELECFNEDWTLKEDSVPFRAEKETNKKYNDLFHDHMYWNWNKSNIVNFGPPFCKNQQGRLICHLCGTIVHKVSVMKHAQSHDYLFFDNFDSSRCEHSSSTNFKSSMKCSNCRVQDDREQKNRLIYLIGKCFPLYDCNLKVVLNKQEYNVSMKMKQNSEYLRDRELRLNSTPDTYEEALVEAAKRFNEMNQFMTSIRNTASPESENEKEEEMAEDQENGDEDEENDVENEENGKSYDETGPSTSSNDSESKLSAYVRNMLLSSYTAEENENYFERDQQNIGVFSSDLYSSFAEFQEVTRQLNHLYLRNNHPTIQDLINISESIGKKYSAVVRWFQKRRQNHQTLCYPDDICNRISMFKRQEHTKMQQISVIEGLKKIQTIKAILKSFQTEWGDTIPRAYVHMICDRTNTHPRFIRNTVKFNFDIPILLPNLGIMEHRKYSDLGKNTKITKAMLVRLNEEYKKCPNLSVEKIKELCYYYHCDDNLIINWFEHRRKVGDNFIEFWKKPGKTNTLSPKKLE